MTPPPPTARACSCFSHSYVVCAWRSAEVPLDVLAKQYAGAYAEGFQWPQAGLQSDDADDDRDDTEGVCVTTNYGLAIVFVS